VTKKTSLIWLAPIHGSVVIRPVAGLQGFGRVGGLKVVQGLRHAAEKCRQPCRPWAIISPFVSNRRKRSPRASVDDAREGGAQQRHLRLVDDRQ
jgi:hypothetical protein